MIISQKKHCFFYSFAYLLLIMAKQALVFESAKELSLKDGMLVIEDKKLIRVGMHARALSRRQIVDTPPTHLQ